jgi:GNAT superfamily N-acetyltransferase
VIDLVPWSAVLPLRHLVLRPGLPLDAARFAEDRAPDTFHVAAHDPDGTVIGCATFFPQPADDPLALAAGPAWVLRGMATHATYRGQGVGGRVLAAGIAEVTRRGGVAVWCRGREAASDFYRRHGFAERGERFFIDPSGWHYHFVRELAA